jgi:ketosteroid isomerase-like protein
MLQHRCLVVRILLVFVALVSLPLALAATEDPSRAVDYDALRNLRSIYEDALNNNDAAMIKPLLADGFTGVMISGEEVKSYDDFDAFWKRFRGLIGEGGTYHVKVITDQTDFIGDMGVSRGYTEETIHTAGGKDDKIQSRWTAVTRKQNGEWKIFRVQGSVNPISNPAIDEMVKTTRLVFGGLGLAAGLVLGLIGGVLIRRKRL